MASCVDVAMTWEPNGEFFTVGALIAPAGIPAAQGAVAARLAGDVAGVLEYAAQAMAADQQALKERAAGRTLRRANVMGNAWSGWYEAITGLPSGW